MPPRLGTARTTAPAAVTGDRRADPGGARRTGPATGRSAPTRWSARSLVAPGSPGGGAAAGAARRGLVHAVTPPGRAPVELTGAAVSAVPAGVALLALAGVAAVVATPGRCVARSGRCSRWPGRLRRRSACAGCSATRRRARPAAGLPRCRRGAVDRARAAGRVAPRRRCWRVAGAVLLLAAGAVRAARGAAAAPARGPLRPRPERRGRARPGPGGVAGAGRRARPHRSSPATPRAGRS